MVHGPEEISQVRINHPLVPLVELSPYLAQCSVDGPPPPVPVVGIIEFRLEDRLQPILQRLLAQPLRLLPAGATVAGRDSHPLGKGASHGALPQSLCS